MRGVEIRGQEETKKFREAMLKKLNHPDNRKKGSWMVTGVSVLMFRMVQEFFELAFALAFFKIAERRFRKLPNYRNYERLQDARQDVLYEAADVGNFAMMAADVCGAISGRTEGGKDGGRLDKNAGGTVHPS